MAYSTNSGRTINPVGSGYNTTQFYGVAKRPRVDTYIGGTQDNGTWLSGTRPNKESRWQHRVGGDGFDVVWNAQNDQLVLASTQFNGFFRSVNGGRSFQYSVNGHGDVGGSTQFLTVLGYSPERPNRVFSVGRSGVWVTQDFGRNWEGVPIPQGAWLNIASGSGRVEVSLANPDIVWAGYRVDDTPPITGSLHLSIDGGRTFRPTTVPDIAPQSSISGLATHPYVAGAAYVLFSVRGIAQDTQDL